MVKTKPQKCPVCNSKKGKLECPRFGALVCTTCCGQERSFEKCPQGCLSLEPLRAIQLEARGELPLRDVWMGGQGSIQILVSREKRSGDLQYVTYLVDLWKLGLKDGFGSKDATTDEVQYVLSGLRASNPALRPVKIEDVKETLAKGIQIRNALGLPLPPEYERYRSIIGPLDDVKLAGSLYKCFVCGVGELSDEVVESIKEVALQDHRSGVAGTPDETMIYFGCESCKQKGGRVHERDRT